MLPNAFVGKPTKPKDSELAAILGDAKPVWEKLLSGLSRDYGLKNYEWSSRSPKSGWSVIVRHEKRNIVYLSPHQGCFTASFALGEKAVEAALTMGLPKPVIMTIRSAKRYVEGTGVRLEVRTLKDIVAVKKLIAIKLLHYKEGTADPSRLKPVRDDRDKG